MNSKNESENSDGIKKTVSFNKNGLRKEFRSLEATVWKWTLNKKEKEGKLPTRKTIRDYACDIYKNAGHAKFKASVGWFRRWEKRYNLKEERNIPLNMPDSSQIKKIKDSCDKKDSPLNTVTSPSLRFPSQNEETLNSTLETFSLDTDKLISDIDMVNSPSELFYFNDNFDKTIRDSIKSSDEACISDIVKELMDDFGRYFSDSDKVECSLEKWNKKYCKYDDDFKSKVINYLKEHRIIEAAAKFDVHPNTVSVWLKDDRFLKHLTEIMVTIPDGKAACNEIVMAEKRFISCLQQKEKDKIFVSHSDVEEILRNLFKESWSHNSHWFAKYCSRYLLGKQFNTTKVYYSESFQKLVINYAKRTSQMKASKVFNIARKQLFNWMKNIDSKSAVSRKKSENELLQLCESENRKPSGSMIRDIPRRVYDKKVFVSCSHHWYYKWCSKYQIPVKRNCDEEIVEWILASYDLNLNVSHNDVQKKALQVYRKRNERNFKASTGWLLRFCRRYMNLLRRIPPLNVSLPQTCEDKISCFRERISEMVSKFGISLNTFGVMDEIPLKLKPPGIINNNPKKPLLRSCGLENVQGAVILACLCNGALLPPLITLKDRNSTSTFHRFHVLYRSNEVIDENVIVFWLENVWFRHVQSPTLLLMDCFPPHESETVKQKLSAHGSHLEIIPKGCSSKLNPLTQAISQQFQDAIDEISKKWFDENSYSWQIGSGSSLSTNDILEWVIKAYDIINTKSTEKTIKSVFEKMELHRGILT